MKEGRETAGKHKKYRGGNPAGPGRADAGKDRQQEAGGPAPARVFRKDDVTSLAITDIGNDGEGIGHADGYTLFVKDAVIGDTVRVKVMKTKKGYGYAKLLDVLTPSPYRVDPPCSIAAPCGGCQIQALSYAQQLAFKQSRVRNLLLRIGGFPEEKLSEVFHPIIGMEEPYRYRNKAQIPIGRDREGRLTAGFYAGRTHSIIPMGDCLIGREGNDDILRRILSWMEDNGIPPYDEKTGEGTVRHVLIRNGVFSGELMVCLVVNAEKVPAEDALVETLREIPGMTSISLSVNRERTNVVMGKKIRLLWGRSTIQDTLHVYGVQYGTRGARALFDTEPAREISFHLSPLSFYQVNPTQTEKLYSVALQFAGLSGTENVWDLYCGVGTISLFLAGSAGRVFGVEVIPAAIEDARKNAEENGIRNAVFQTGKVEEVLPEYVKATGDRPDVVVVDPPRKGCDEKCLETILAVKPQKVVYVSCDPATLARDLKILTESAYELREVQPVDMFPHSVHVETVCLLCWKGVDRDAPHVNIEYKPKKEDFAGLSGSADTVKGGKDAVTYRKIEDWIAAEYGGMKVSSLYIGQVKSKLGMKKERDGDDRPRKHHQPKVTPEKEKAIIAAFRHFGMIPALAYEEG